jgi:hypothetical protein
MRTGVTPTGRTLNNEYMPWHKFAQLGGDELQALWMYVRSLPAAR